MAVRTNLSRVPTLEADVEASIEKLATARTTDEKGMPANSIVSSLLQLINISEVTLLRRISPKLGARESRDHFSPIVHSSKMIQILAEVCYYVSLLFYPSCIFPLPQPLLHSPPFLSCSL